MSFGGGSGGSGSISGSTDAALSNPANGQVLGYNGTLSKWQNQNPASLAAVENTEITGTSGSAFTIPDVSIATIHNLTLTANCTITMPTATAGASFTLLVHQDSTGSRTITWPASVKWPGGTAPTLTTTASAIDCITFLCAQTYWLGFLAGSNLQ